MDNLDIWMRHAEKMGYGVRYGKCHADAEAGIIPMPPELQEEAPAVPLGEKAKKCLYCGAVFYPKNIQRMYCSSDCAMKNHLRRKQLANAAAAMQHGGKGRKRTNKGS